MAIQHVNELSLLFSNSLMCRGARYVDIL